MRAIFISYRRSDAEGQAGRLFKDLSDRFGKGAVFIDVAGIDPGRDFRVVLNDTLATCGALISLIGPDWLGAAPGGGARRIDSAHDFIRIETAAALKRDIPVFPVLVRQARMPTEDELPDDLKELVFRQATEVRHAHWDADVRELGDALARYVDVRPVPTPTPAPKPRPTPRPDSGRTGPSRLRQLVLVGLTVAVMLAAGLYVAERSRSSTEIVPTRPMTVDSSKIAQRPERPATQGAANADTKTTGDVVTKSTAKKASNVPGEATPAIDASSDKPSGATKQRAITTYEDFPSALAAVVADAKNNFANLRRAKDGDGFVPAVAIANGGYRLFDIVQSAGYWDFQIQNGGNIEDEVKEYEYKRKLIEQVFADNGIKYELVLMGAPGTRPLQSYEFKSPQLTINFQRTPKGATFLHTIDVLHPM